MKQWLKDFIIGFKSGLLDWRSHVKVIISVLFTILFIEQINLNIKWWIFAIIFFIIYEIVSFLWETIQNLRDTK